MIVSQEGNPAPQTCHQDELNIPTFIIPADKASSEPRKRPIAKPPFETTTELNDVLAGAHIRETAAKPAEEQNLTAAEEEILRTRVKR